MRWRTWLWSAAAAAMLVAAVQAADAPAPAAKPADAKKADEAKKPGDAAKSTLEDELAVMARECQLNAEQQVKLASAAAEAKAGLDGWEKKHADRLAAFKKARAAAVEAKDEAALKKAVDDVRPLIEENRALQAKYQATILAILTPPQKILLQGFALSMELGGRMKGFNLTDAQSAKVRGLCDQAAKELAEVKGEGEEAMTAQRTILGKLELAIRDNVLTAEQKKLLAPPPETVPAADPKTPEGANKPAAEKPAAEKK